MPMAMYIYKHDKMADQFRYVLSAEAYVASACNSICKFNVLTLNKIIIFKVGKEMNWNLSGIGRPFSSYAADIGQFQGRS